MSEKFHLTVTFPFCEPQLFCWVLANTSTSKRTTRDVQFSIRKTYKYVMCIPYCKIVIKSYKFYCLVLTKKKMIYNKLTFIIRLLSVLVNLSGAMFRYNFSSSSPPSLVLFRLTLNDSKMHQEVSQEEMRIIAITVMQVCRRVLLSLSTNSLPLFIN